MGSLETGLSVKRDQHLLRPSSAISRNERNPFGQRPRSWLARLFIKKFDFLQCSCTIAVFFFFAILFQMLLLGSVVEKSENSWIGRKVASSDLMFWKEIGELDFGENVKFEPKKLLAKFRKESREVNASAGSRTGMRIGYRKPQLALVFANLLLDPQQILMATVAVALRDIGYKIEVYSLEDGPLLVVWTRIGVPVNILKTSEKKIVVDWLSYDGIIVNSIEAREVISCLLQEPFKSVPLIWSIHERTLATHLTQYMLSGKVEMAKDWQKLFNRSTVIVFPNYVLPLLYSASDSGNYYVVPGSPAEVWEVDNFVVSDKDNLRLKLGFGLDDFIIAIVGSQFLYRGLWLEHAFILKALLPVSADFQSESDSYPHLKIIVMSGDSTSNYSVALETVAHNLKYPSGIVKHVAVDQDRNSILSIADLVIYGSFLEEPSFPDILIRAMSFGKPIIAPDLSMIRKYVDDRVNGYIFPKENIRVLTQIIMEVVLKGKLSSLARNIASIGKNTAKNLMVSEAVEGYASLIESVLKLPSEVAPPKTFTEISSKLKEEWQWRLFESITNSSYPNRTLRINRFLDNIEKQWNRTMESSGSVTVKDETFLYSIWEEQKHIDMANTRKRREEEELKDRTDQTRGTWEDVYRNVKRADRTKNDLHERDERELERTGQPLCIYEPYFGEGIWPFLHNTSLYRGLGLSSRGRRPGADDIDGPSRLPLLSNPYYRDALGEYGAFFAIANRIDRTHKNAWIGFQSWRATARKESLSKTAETALLDAIQARRHGDALYFWAPMDVDPRYQSKQDFWSFCDAINAGNCNFTVSEALKKMYGIKQNWTSLPPMPIDGDTWSVMHSWALPTKSFLEFIMFSRMFVDTLDAQFFEEHHRSGHCYLSLSKDKRCYTRVLELLVNVWAYHSARRMVYVNPETGVMQELHKLKNRRGQMWVKWFSFDTLKSMDEELAEEFDSGWHKRRWLWPLTGEVFWQGMIEKERNQRNREKEKRRQQSKEKLLRMKKRQRQKTIGKYVKPPPEEMQDLPLNSTVATAKLLR